MRDVRHGLVELWMVRAAGKHRQDGRRRGWAPGAGSNAKTRPLYLNLIVIEVQAVKPLHKRFLPQLKISVLVLRYLH